MPCSRKGSRYRISTTYRIFGHRPDPFGYPSMSLNHKPPVLDARPLLDERPISYHSTNDAHPSSPTNPVERAQPVDNLSKSDLCWILAGLWSGVLLGAFDGMEHRFCILLAKLKNDRNGRGYPADTNWERIQCFA